MMSITDMTGMMSMNTTETQLAAAGVTWIDLAAFNADPSWTLPMPARYVIGQDGTIVYAEVNPDYTQRPEPEDVIGVLEQARRAA